MSYDNRLDRINREWKLCKKSVTLGTIGASAGPVKKGELSDWEAIISGPNDTPYEGGVFTLTIKFGNNYPSNAPEIKVKPIDGVIPIFHPNINTSDGTICLSILNNFLSQCGQITKVYSIFHLNYIILLNFCQIKVNLT